MSNQAKGEFRLQIGERWLTFKVGTQALILGQEEVGRQTGKVPMLDQYLGDVLRTRLLYVQVFLWAALRKYHPEIALDAVPDLLDEMGESQAKALLDTLSGSTQPDPKDTEALPKADPPVAQTKRTRSNGREASISAPAVPA